MTADIAINKNEGILTIALTRPDKKNALTTAMYAALADALAIAEAESDIRVILLQAAGDMFTAGNDINEFASQVMQGSGGQEVVRFLKSLASITKPLVAAVQGKAVGVGTTMLLHCDYVLVADNAELSTPFVNLALVPEAASSYLLPSRIGHVRAFEMFALGEPVAAQDAVAWGMANKCVPLAALDEEARQVARRLAAKPAISLQTTKKLMRDAERLIAQTDLELSVFMARLQSAEAREAFAAFVQKRRPDFTNLV